MEECVKSEWSDAFPEEFQLGVELGFCRRKGGEACEPNITRRFIYGS